MVFIDGDISDLFFNLDHDDAIIDDDTQGGPTGFDEAKLKASAVELLARLRRLGCDVSLPLPDALVADFLRRL